MASEPDPDLLERSERFAERLRDTLLRTIVPEDPVVGVDFGNDGRVFVASGLEAGGSLEDRWIPLKAAGMGLKMRFRFWLTWDHLGRYLAVDNSSVGLALASEREPLVRFEYEREIRAAHTHVHAESAALAHYLTLKDPKTKLPKVQVMHLPVGGERFRPCLEDIIEFAVDELGVVAVDEWRAVVESGREQWRWFQLASVVRDVIRQDSADGPRRIHELVDKVVQDLQDAARATER